VVKMKFTLKNTGKVKGAESAQVYITQEKCSVLRPSKELKGFSKTLLNAGESREVEISLPVKDWAFFNDKTQTWDLEPGRFMLQLGSSSGDIRQKVEVTIQ